MNPIALGVDARNLAADRRGMGRYVRGVLRAACNDPRFAVTLLFPKPPKPDSLAGLEAGGRFTTARSGRTGQYDVIWFPWNRIRFRTRAPSLVTIHDAFAFSEPHSGAIARRREQLPVRTAARGAALIVTDSEWSRGELMRILHIEPDRITAVPLAPDPFFFPQHEDPPPELCGKPFVLFVAGPERRKNARFLFNAFTAAFPRGEATLVVVGNLARDDENFLSTLPIDSRRIAADDEMLRRLYRTAAFVAVPSLAEGFGLVAVEAMACGAAVVAADASALRESAAHAWLLPPDNIVAWRAALRAVFDAPERLAELRERAAAAWGFAPRDGFAHATLDLIAALARPA